MPDTVLGAGDSIISKTKPWAWGTYKQIYTCTAWREGRHSKLRNRNYANSQITYEAILHIIYVHIEVNVSFNDIQEHVTVKQSVRVLGSLPHQPRWKQGEVLTMSVPKARKINGYGPKYNKS